MAKRRRRRQRGLGGLPTLKMGTRIGNVLLGAGVSAAGNVLGPRIPIISNLTATLPGSPGMVLGLGLAGINWFQDNKQVAMDIALGAALPSLMLVLEEFLKKTWPPLPAGELEMGLIKAEAQRMGYVVAQAQMADGSNAQLAKQRHAGEIPAGVLQGLTNYSVEVMQGAYH